MEVENLVLEQLRLMRNEFAMSRTEWRDDLRDIKARLGVVESNVAYLIQNAGNSASSIAGLHVALDRLNARQERTERRLEIVDQ